VLVSPFCKGYPLPTSSHFEKPTKVAGSSKAELVRYRLSDSTTGQEGLFYTGSLRKAYEPALQGRDKISMRGLIKGDTEKSTPTLLYERRGFIVISPFDKGG